LIRQLPISIAERSRFAKAPAGCEIVVQMITGYSSHWKLPRSGRDFIAAAEGKIAAALWQIAVTPNLVARQPVSPRDQWPCGSEPLHREIAKVRRSTRVLKKKMPHRQRLWSHFDAHSSHWPLCPSVLPIPSGNRHGRFSLEGKGTG
jgi:hypothetical protein